MASRSRSNPNRRITIRDVAAAAGVTPMTVSNVLNRRAGEVGRETQDRVIEVCRQLGYKPHASARRLRTDRRMAVGLVIVDPSPNYLSDPFIAALFAGLTDCLGPQGYSLVLHGSHPDGVGAIPLLQQIETDALCAVLSGSLRQRRAFMRRLAEARQPLVLLQEEHSELVGGLAGDDVCTVVQDDRGGGVAIAQHLLTGSCQHIVMLVPEIEWSAMVRREAGLRAVLSRARPRRTLRILPCGDEGYVATQAALAAYVARHGLPDTVVGGNDQMAIAAMKFFQARGLVVPRDIRVTGFNGFEVWRYSSPELTTVFSPAYDMGRNAGQAILARLQNGRFPFREQVLSVTLQANGSS
ncbi:LacI family DNA-binding transcriptional regulator [Vineibacter terrae]|uniref:LacI family transcriptional regulator n=1 Tax=Vineibacter terrae TaxID=2586908 RepID=A0A5C8PB84_9HYPH|nr:LacI family DNA-binding transcriptional regulator [Vineibacter terrae]TXL70816.1 LacI family transcriptional regulator [Vineibacter terrae]HEX2886263.1 LacI family DNA-binding transcriptional regulator [Vineibacter terrae]